MGGAGGSQNLIANLLASKQAQPAAAAPSAQVIQTPDQFKLAQDIKAIKAEQADIAEEVAEQKKERKARSDKGTTGIRAPYKQRGLTAEEAEEAAKGMLKATTNLSKLSGEVQEDIAAGAAGAAMQAHEEAGAKLPAEAKKAPGKVQSDAFGGHKKGKRGEGGRATGELAEKGEDAKPELKE